MKKYRDNGAIGALLDEYELAISNLKDRINDVSQKELVAIVDNKTQDPSCKSIQTILTHVVRSGYWYVIEIRRSMGEQISLPSETPLHSINDYQSELDHMFNFNEKLFDDYPDLKIEAFDHRKKVKVRWGQLYDVEQLFEHAIVHILRHRRQIERFLNKLR